MTKVLFVCHGNICRSAMAENMFRALLHERGIDWVSVDSAATSREEIGNPILSTGASKVGARGGAGVWASCTPADEGGL